MSNFPLADLTRHRPAQRRRVALRAWLVGDGGSLSGVHLRAAAVGAHIRGSGARFAKFQPLEPRRGPRQGSPNEPETLPLRIGPIGGWGRFRPLLAVPASLSAAAVAARAPRLPRVRGKVRPVPPHYITTRIATSRVTADKSTRIAAGTRYDETRRAGEEPSGDREFQYFWIFLFGYAESVPDLKLYEEGVAAVEGRWGTKSPRRSLEELGRDPSRPPRPTSFPWQPGARML